MSIEWSETARADLREFRRFIARDSQHYASRMMDRIRRAVESMSLNPDAGHWLPEIEHAISVKSMWRAIGSSIACEVRLCKY